MPPDVVRRRYARGIANFVNLYMPISDSWRVYDNSRLDGPQRVARKTPGDAPVITDEYAWNSILETAARSTRQDDL